MKSEFKEPEYWAYEKRPWHLRARLLQEAANHAEWDVPKNRIGGLIRQQRHRAHGAITRGRWLFTLLFVVITFGLSYYVGLPIWQQIQDGSKTRLETEARVLDTQLAQMDTDRDLAWESLKRSLRFVAHPQSFPDESPSSTLSWTTKDNSRLVLLYPDGKVSYTDTAGRSWSKTQVPIPPEFANRGFRFRPLDEDRSRVILTLKGQVSDSFVRGSVFPSFVSSDHGATWSRSMQPEKIPNDVAMTASYFDNSLAIAVVGGFGIRSIDFGATWNLIDMGPNVTDIESNFVRSGKIIWTQAGQKSVVLSQDEGITWVNVPLPEGPFEEVFVFQVSSKEIRIGTNDQFVPQEIYISNDLGNDWILLTQEELEAEANKEPLIEEPIVEEVGIDRDFSLGDKQFNISSDDRQIIIERTAPELVTLARFPNFGNDLTNSFWTDNEKLALLVVLDSFGDLDLTGTVDGGATWINFPSAFYGRGGVEFKKRVASTDELALLISNGGDDFIRIDDFFFQQLAPINLDRGLAGDQSYRQAIARLPEALRNDAIFKAKVDVINRTTLERESLQRDREAKLNEANEIGGTGFSLSQRRRDFEEFMRTCGVGSKDCINAYMNLREDEEQSIWRFVAERAPPAVLILFLLATLGGLYRYNLRLTGFHHSRADALELLDVIHGDAAKVTKDDLTAFAALADQIAADKVEFGKSSTPTDQAVALARVIAQRG